MSHEGTEHMNEQEVEKLGEQTHEGDAVEKTGTEVPADGTEVTLEAGPPGTPEEIAAATGGTVIRDAAGDAIGVQLPDGTVVDRAGVENVAVDELGAPLDEEDAALEEQAQRARESAAAEAEGRPDPWADDNEPQQTPPAADDVHAGDAQAAPPTREEREADAEAEHKRRFAERTSED